MSEFNRSEKEYLIRYFGAGMVNAIFGLGTISVLTALNFNPIISNFTGFAVGMLLSFTLAKFFVFKQRNNTKKQGKRYIISFGISYGLNVIVLLLSKNHMHNAIAQAMAIATYVVAMYIFMRFYIFIDKT